MINNSLKTLRKRNERIFFLYRNYLVKNSINDSKKEIFSKEYSFCNEQIEFINDIIRNIQILELEIKKFIAKGWDLERFNYIEKAILLNAAAEILIAKNKLEIVVDESLNFAKKYSTVEAPALINAIIDKIGHNNNKEILSQIKTTQKYK